MTIVTRTALALRWLWRAAACACALTMWGCADMLPERGSSLLKPRATPIQSTAAVLPTSSAVSACSESLLPDAAPSGAAPASETTAVRVTYESASNTVRLIAGSTNLAGLADALPQPGLLDQLGPGEWLLNANVIVERDATLQVAAPDARRLRLRSDPQGFVWIKALGGTLLFERTCVTSWDAQRNAVDEATDDGRSFILARDGAHMNIESSELSYLGYEANESYGVAWRLEGTAGTISNSRFSYNFYGLYAYEASGLTIRGNEVDHSVRYGIDPHTASNHLLIEGNHAHHNGKQGIILAEGCSDSVVRDNVVYANEIHGIVIYQGSNRNIVEGNRVFGNVQQGININDAVSNVVRDNEVYENGKDGIGLGQDANDNRVSGNRVYRNAQDGITLYSGATLNNVHDNSVSDNGRYGIYAKSGGNNVADNQAANNRSADHFGAGQ